MRNVLLQRLCDLRPAGPNRIDLYDQLTSNLASWLWRIEAGGLRRTRRASTDNEKGHRVYYRPTLKAN